MPKCQSERVVPNGPAAGNPQKRCQHWGYQFTRTTPRGKPLQTKMLAVLLSLSGLSMNRMAPWCDVSAQAVLHWIRAFAHEHDETPKPDSAVVILELDELWPYAKKTAHALDLESAGCGSRSTA